MFYFIKKIAAKGGLSGSSSGREPASRTGSQRVHHGFREWSLGYQQACTCRNVQCRPGEDEDDRDESIRMKCSGKSAAAGHKGREKNSRGGGEVRTARKAGDRFLCDGGKPSPSLPEKTAESLPAVRESNSKRNQNTL